MNRLSESVRELRTANGYTQEQLAGICGVSRQAVAKWESGTNFPDVEKLLRLAQLFHTSVDALLTGDRAPAPAGSGSSLRPEGSTGNEAIVNQALKKAMACKDPGEEIRQFISYIGYRIGCDRMYIFEPNPDGSYRNSYEWCGRGVAPQIEYLQAIPREDMSLWLKAFSRGEYVFVEDVDAIAESEPAVYRWLKPQGIRSLLVFPLFGGRSFLGADNPAPAFISQTSSLLEIMAHFAETMLQRRDLERELKQAVLENDRFGRLSGGVRYQFNVQTGKLLYDPEQVREAGYPQGIDSLARLEETAAAHPEFRDHLMLDGMQRVLDTKENLSIEFLSYKKDRSVRWNRLSVSPLLDHEGTVLQLYGLLRDVSGEHRIVEQYNKYIAHLSGGLHVCYLSRPIHLEYASDDLCGFLGYSREEFEGIVCGKYTNIIVEEDRPAFAAYAQRLAAAPGIESCEYRLRKKDGTTVQVIDTMESVADSSGIMYGYAYVLAKSELHTMLEMAEEHEKRQLAVIDRQFEVLEALGRDYLNVFRVWLDEDRAQIVKLQGYVTKGMNRESAEYFPYYRFCEQYVQDRVFPEDRQKMLKAMHPDTVRQAFASEDEYLVVYRAVDHGEVHFYQLKYIRLRNPGDGDRISFVAGFKNVDRVIREEHRQMEELQSRLDMISAILRAFSCGYYYSRKEDTFTELSNINESMSRLIGKSGSFSENRKRMEILFPDREAYYRINSFLSPETLDERLEGRKSLSAQIPIRGIGWYEMYLFVVDCDGEGKVSHCIFAARDITREKEQEEEYIRSLDQAGNRERAALQYACTDALTEVMNRNAYERDIRGIGAYNRVGFVFCDVNRLKLINDTQGHGMGDRRLKEFSALLKRHFSVDCIYRTGGDEFVCMIGNLEEAGFRERVDKLVREAEACGHIAAVGCSYGDPARKDELIREAEAAMYAMKGKGRDR